MSGFLHPNHAINQYILMREKATEIADSHVAEQFGAVLGDMVHDEHSGLHYIPVTKLIDDIELAKTHVWEDGRVEEVF